MSMLWLASCVGIVLACVGDYAEAGVSRVTYFSWFVILLGCGLYVEIAAPAHAPIGERVTKLLSYGAFGSVLAATELYPSATSIQWLAIAVVIAGCATAATQSSTGKYVQRFIVAFWSVSGVAFLASAAFGLALMQPIAVHSSSETFSKLRFVGTGVLLIYLGLTGVAHTSLEDRFRFRDVDFRYTPSPSSDSPIAYALLPIKRTLALIRSAIVWLGVRAWDIISGVISFVAAVVAKWAASVKEIFSDKDLWDAIKDIVVLVGLAVIIGRAAGRLASVAVEYLQSSGMSIGLFAKLLGLYCLGIVLLLTAQAAVARQFDRDCRNRAATSLIAIPLCFVMSGALAYLITLATPFKISGFNHIGAFTAFMLVLIPVAVYHDRVTAARVPRG